MRIEYLADRPELVPVITGWFEAEWPQWYGVGKENDARRDLEASSRKNELPIVLVAFIGEEPVSTASLRDRSIPSHTHLTPWATRGLTLEHYRNQGIGAELLTALERVARDLGYPTIYCGTSQANTLLERSGWQLRERTDWDGEEMAIYEKGL